jgi:hypothetical protein
MKKSKKTKMSTSTDDEVERLVRALGGVLVDVAGCPSTILALRRVLDNHLGVQAIFKRHSCFDDMTLH